MKRLFFVAVCACLCAASALADDSINWGQLGSNRAVLSTYQPWTSQSGQYTGTVGLTSESTFERLDQGNGWNGNFYPGDHVIWNEGGPAAHGMEFLIFFDQLVYGGGAQIQAAYYGEFWASIIAFNSNGYMIGEVDKMGESNANGDGSAIYLSYLSDLPDVKYIEFYMYDINGGESMALDQFTIYTNAAVPEPASLALLGSGLLASIVSLRKRIGL